MVRRYSPLQEEELKRVIVSRIEEVSQEIDQHTYEIENPQDTSDEVDRAAAELSLIHISEPTRPY